MTPSRVLARLLAMLFAAAVAITTIPVNKGIAVGVFLGLMAVFFAIWSIDQNSEDK
jgi:hypothetical protein